MVMDTHTQMDGRDETPHRSEHNHYERGEHQRCARKWQESANRGRRRGEGRTRLQVRGGARRFEAVGSRKMRRVNGVAVRGGVGEQGRRMVGVGDAPMGSRTKSHIDVYVINRSPASIRVVPVYDGGFVGEIC